MPIVALLTLALFVVVAISFFGRAISLLSCANGYLSYVISFLSRWGRRGSKHFDENYDDEGSKKTGDGGRGHFDFKKVVDLIGCVG